MLKTSLKSTVGRLSFTLAMAAALSLGACQRPGYSSNASGWDDGSYSRYCTDRAGNRVPDTNCYRGGNGGSNAFLWYYLGRSSATPAYGSHVYGGSYSAPARASTTSGRSWFGGSPTVSRGGFGTTGGSHGFSAGG